MSKTIYDLKLHESLDVSENQRSETIICKRVAGGWIYTTFDYNTHNDRNVISSVFVPFNNEFQTEQTDIKF